MSEIAPASLYLDVQAGTVRTGSGQLFDVTPHEMILLYWLALAAPEERIGRALQFDDGAGVGPRAKALRERLGLGNAAPELALSNGRPPFSASPWLQRTAITIIRKGLARRHQDPLVYVADEGALTVGEVSDLVRRIGARLHEEGVGKGSWVAVDATQRLESFLVSVATLLIGGVVVRLGDSAGPATLRKMIRQAPAVMTFSARFDQIGALPETGKRVSFLTGEEVPDFSEWAKAGSASRDLETSDTVSPSDPAFIGFTSGSTGEPKAIITSHEAVFRTTEIAMNLFRFQPDDIFCTAMDFTALGGFRSMVTFPFWCGGRVVLPTELARHQPLALALVCQRYGVTRLTAVPNVLRGFVKAGDRLRKNGLPDLRTVFSIAGILDRSTAEEFRDRFDAAIVDYYGATEIGNVAFTDPDQPGTMSSRGGWASEVLIRVLDENGTPCAPVQAGEICVHTGNLMLGYLGPVDDSVPVRDGWYWTGDLGRVHPDGRVEIIGRRRDIVKTHDGGLVSPLEIENVLYASNVVREACVFGWSDGDGIERLGASVILSAPRREDDQKAVEIQLKTRVLEELGLYKVPAHIVLRDDFPRVARGKPDKRKLRQEFETAITS